MLNINKLRFRNITCLVFVLVLAGCGRDADDSSGQAPPLTAATLGEQQVMSASDYLSSSSYVTADRNKGRQLAFTCRACHTLEPGGAQVIGPNLHGMFGQRAGTRKGFDYSDAMKESNFVWTPRALDAWLRAPATFLPGNRMSFIGVSSEDDRRDLIGYLLVATETDNR